MFVVQHGGCGHSGICRSLADGLPGQEVRNGGQDQEETGELIQRILKGEVSLYFRSPV